MSFGEPGDVSNISLWNDLVCGRIVQKYRRWAYKHTPNSELGAT